MARSETARSERAKNVDSCANHMNMEAEYYCNNCKMAFCYEPCCRNHEEDHIKNYVVDYAVKLKEVSDKVDRQKQMVSTFQKDAKNKREEAVQLLYNSWKSNLVKTKQQFMEVKNLIESEITFLDNLMEEQTEQIKIILKESQPLKFFDEALQSITDEAIKNMKKQSLTSAFETLDKQQTNFTDAKKRALTLFVGTSERFVFHNDFDQVLKNYDGEVSKLKAEIDKRIKIINPVDKLKEALSKPLKSAQNIDSAKHKGSESRTSSGKSVRFEHTQKLKKPGERRNSGSDNNQSNENLTTDRQDSVFERLTKHAPNKTAETKRPQTARVSNTGAAKQPDSSKNYKKPIYKPPDNLPYASNTKQSNENLATTETFAHQNKTRPKTAVVSIIGAAKQPAYNLPPIPRKPMMEPRTENPSYSNNYGNKPTQPATWATYRKTLRYSDQTGAKLQSSNTKTTKTDVIILAGGTGSKNFYMYNPITKTFTDVAQMLSTRCLAGAAFMSGIVFFAGGYARIGNNNIICSSVEMYNIKDNTWFRKSQMWTERVGLALVSFQNCLFAIGGSNNNEVLNSVEAYNNTSNDWKQVQSLKQKRYKFCAASSGKIILVCGGSDGTNDIRTCESLDSIKSEWTSAGSLVTPRSSAAVVSYKDKFYIFGGYNRISLDTVEEYNCDDKTWTQLPIHLSQPRHYLSAVCANEKFYVLGGKNIAIKSKIVDCFDPENNFCRTEILLGETISEAAAISVPVTN